MTYLDPDDDPDVQRRKQLRRIEWKIGALADTTAGLTALAIFHWRVRRARLRHLQPQPL